MSRKLNGLNILPRDGADLGKTIEYHREVKPAVSLVFLEPGWVEPLRQVSPETLFIYRHWPDDHVYDLYSPEEFVDMLHRIAPPGCALYLGNEPGNMERTSSWSISALNRCDSLNRTGVVANLAYGWPPEDAWGKSLNPLLRRVSGTRHIIGLHEYWHNKDLGIGFWVDRVRHLFATSRAQGLQDPKVVITEMGATNNGDPYAGWKRAGLSSQEYLNQLLYIFDNVYNKYPTLLGANIFSWGTWNGFEIHQDQIIINGLKNWRPKPMTNTVPTRKPIKYVAEVQELSGDWNVRAGVGTSSLVVGKLQNGDFVEVTLGQGTANGYQWAIVNGINRPITGFVALLDNPPNGFSSRHLAQVVHSPGNPIQNVVRLEDLDFMITKLDEWRDMLY